MKYLKRFNEELTNNSNDEVEMIYRDKNMVCLIPKTQRMAYIYGYRTKWCNVTKNRFDELTFDYKILVIVFLFKEKYDKEGSYGYKLRLVYNPDTKTGDWGDNSGKHILDFENKDPFELEMNPRNIDEMTKRAFSKISEIPQECKNNVRKYLSKEKTVDFIKNDEYNLKTPLQRRKYEDKKRYLEFKHDSLPAFLDIIKDKPGYTIDTKYNTAKDKFTVTYSAGGKPIYREFKSFDEFIKFMIELVQEMTN